MSEPTLPDINGFKGYLEVVPMFKNGTVEMEHRYGFKCLGCRWGEQGVYSKEFVEHMPMFYNAWTRNHVHKFSGNQE